MKKGDFTVMIEGTRDVAELPELKTFDTDIDIGYARECVAILSAGISMAVAGSADVDRILQTVLRLDPFDLGGPFGGPVASERLRGFLEAERGATTPDELADVLSTELAQCHPFDPVKTLAIAFAATEFSPSDPLTAVLIAANHREMDGSGRPGRFLDVDCYAAVTGALSGGHSGGQRVA